MIKPITTKAVGLLRQDQLFGRLLPTQIYIVAGAGAASTGGAGAAAAGAAGAGELMTGAGVLTPHAPVAHGDETGAAEQPQGAGAGAAAQPQGAGAGAAQTGAGAGQHFSFLTRTFLQRTGLHLAGLQAGSQPQLANALPEPKPTTAATKAKTVNARIMLYILPNTKR